MAVATAALFPALLGNSGVAGAKCVPEFGPHLLELRSDVGDSMGHPLDCEQPLDGAGNTIQPTSTGTAWYTSDAHDNHSAIFTNGYQRWELDVGGLTYWSTPQAVPLLMDGLPDGPAVWQRAVNCPVLYTHEVPVAASFRRFLSGLMQAGFQPVSFGLVDAAMRGEVDVPAGCVVLSFDDALQSQLQNAVPVLAEFGATGLFFVMPAYEDGRHQYLGANGIRALHEAGQTVGAHTCNHP
ncbi:MAG: polysaccharide deacetylase family protein, partial [Chloroflexota bacterium]